MRARARQAIGRAVLETLEERRLLSSVTFADGVMTLEGEAGSADRISVSLSARGLLVWGLVNNQGVAIPTRRIEAINVVGDAGVDRISIPSGLKIPVQVQPAKEDQSSGSQPPPPAGENPPETHPRGNIGGGSSDPPQQTPKQETSPRGDVGYAKMPIPAIQMIGGSGLTGQAVHVHALDSTLGAGTVLTAQFDWDFGDPAGRYNNLSGFNAAHVYDQPGVYTITLRITNEAGLQASATAQVNVGVDTRRTIYVSAKGNDRNDGLAPDRAVRSFERAMQLLQDDTRILFRRGDTFQVIEGGIIGFGNVLIGAYGQGDLPTLKWAGSRQSQSMLGMNGGSRDITIENLRFDSIYNRDTDQAGMPFAIAPRGTNIAIRGNEFLNVGYAIQNNGKPRGVLAVDNRAPLETGIRGYFSWVEGSDHVYLGNVVVNSTREHVIRAGDVQRILIAHNDLANIGRQPHDLYDTSKTTINLQGGSWAYVAGNRLERGAVSVGPLGGADGLRNAAGQRWNWAVFDGNSVYHTEMQVRPGASGIMLRNNMIYSHDTAITVIAHDPVHPQRTLNGIYVMYNQAFNSSERGRFLMLQGRAVGAITLVGNQYHAQNLVPGAYTTGGVVAFDHDLRSFREIRDNIWPMMRPTPWAQGGYHYVWPTWSDQRGYLSPEDWLSMPQVQGDEFQ